MRYDLSRALGALLLAFSLRADAQQQAAKIPRIGFLSPFSSSDTPHQAFREGLRDLGWVEGKNIEEKNDWKKG